MLKSMLSAEIKKIKWALSLALLFILVGCGILFATILQNNKPAFLIGNAPVSIEYARTPDEKFRGLCCRDFLPENSGMLFVYNRPGNYRFVMRDTRIPLDMYWISSGKEVVHIEHSVQPSSYPKTYGTNTPAQYILETNAGFAKRHNIKVGDTVKF